MGRELIRPRIDNLYRKKITDLIRSLAKKFEVYAVFVIKTTCTNCVIDPATKASTGVYNKTGPKPFTGRVCPVCLGKGSTTTEKKHKLTATVEWSELTKSDANRDLAQGEIPYAHAMLKTFINAEPALAKADYFLVDGIRCTRATVTRPTGLLTKVLAHVLVKRED
jgi:hypothetical protein